jgi:hypothetical protein
MSGRKLCPNGGFLHDHQNTTRFLPGYLTEGEPNDLVQTERQRLTLVLLSAEGYRVEIHKRRDECV